MAEYRQYCPVARATEIFADRWTPLIVRELLGGAQRFNQLQRGLPGISRSLLASRLRRLEDQGVVHRATLPAAPAVDYQLSESGRELEKVIDMLGAWGARWAFGEPRPAELDPALLLWKMHRRVHLHRLPAERTAIEFDFAGRGGRRVWLVLERREVSVCLKPPGFRPQLVLHADLSLFYRVWLGAADYALERREGRIVVDGPPALARALPGWFKWSPMAGWVRAGASTLARPPNGSETRAVKPPRHRSPRRKTPSR
ncbi:MAG TPA: helix-turn-helix domain-containing protein [Polyangia bacterium]|nr:helix-turn-helix domain-containing protein [Polyangia bacterium]